MLRIEASSRRVLLPSGEGGYAAIADISFPTGGTIRIVSQLSDAEIAMAQRAMHVIWASDLVASSGACGSSCACSACQAGHYRAPYGSEDVIGSGAARRHLTEVVGRAARSVAADPVVQLVSVPPDPRAVLAAAGDAGKLLQRAQERGLAGDLARRHVSEMRQRARAASAAGQHAHPDIAAALDVAHLDLAHRAAHVARLERELQGPRPALRRSPVLRVSATSETPGEDALRALWASGAMRVPVRPHYDRWKALARAARA